MTSWIASAFGFSLASLAWCASSQTPLEDLQAAQKVAQQRALFRVYVREVPEPKGRVHYSPITSGDYGKAAGYLRVLAQEFDKYPEGVVRQMEIRGLGIVKDLSRDGRRVAGTNDSGAILLDVRAFASDRRAQRSAFHHEAFHAFDDGRDDTMWSSFNPPGFSYKSCTQPAACRRDLDFPSPGFVSRYAMSEPSEDRAETFSALMVTEHYIQLQRKIKKDRYLSAKVAHLIGVLNKADSKIDQAYFRQLHGGGL